MYYTKRNMYGVPARLQIVQDSGPVYLIRQGTLNSHSSRFDLTRTHPVCRHKLRLSAVNRFYRRVKAGGKTSLFDGSVEAHPIGKLVVCGRELRSGGMHLINGFYACSCSRVSGIAEEV